ncbi:uncharacterized protein LOC143364583, partial [Halictus rubicundus]|uniref:uncharacterized protein LOC143364583 n=1 Tax=Halictus rubicundus TaxID=77578 RepID=UPI0040350E93
IQQSFEALGKPVEEWDEWFVFLPTEKLDETTRLAWEATLVDPTAVPEFQALEDFLENRSHVHAKQHHTTIHDAYVVEDRTPSESVEIAAIHAVKTHQGIPLATAKVQLEAPDGQTLLVRALLDSGSETSFLSEWAAQTLRLRKRAVRVSLTGYQGTAVGTARSEVQVSLRSPIDPGFQMDLETLVTKSLVAPTPSKQVVLQYWSHIQGLPLADPEFANPAHVDVLLGADVCGLLFRERKVGPAGTSVAVRTPFGWTLIGPVGEETSSVRKTRVHHVSCQEPLPDLRRFWEIEEVPSSQPLSPEDLKWEEERPPTGIQDAPQRRDQTSTGLAAQEPLRGLHAGERDPGSYIPHHAVWKEIDGKKKIRVVFNASAASIAGRSLNDELLPGPKLQSDLWAIITPWRLFRVAFSTDIVKMFR